MVAECAKVALQLQRVMAKLKVAISKDEASYTQSVAKLLRAVLKQGRKFKAPRTAPVFLGPDGELIVDAQETTTMLAQHFATAERGSETTVQQVQNELRVVKAEAGQVEEVVCIPSLADLVQACRSLQDGRATGLRGIPAEAFKYASFSAARALYPMLLRFFGAGSARLIGAES